MLGRQAAIKRGETAPEEEVYPKFVGHSNGSSDYVGANWIAYTSADSNGEYDQAAKHLDNCLAKCSTVKPSFREELILAAARFQATRRRKNDLARQWLNSGNKRGARINRACTEALVLSSEGRIDDALGKTGELSKLVARLPTGKTKTLQQDAVQQLREFIEKYAQEVVGNIS